MAVAARAGHELKDIECGEGRCGSCEMELLRDEDDEEGTIIRACIARVPKAKSLLVLREIQDPLWGGS